MRPLASAIAAIALYGWVNGSLAAGVARLDQRLDLSASEVAVHLTAFAVGLIAVGFWGHRAPAPLRHAAPYVFALALVPFLAAPHTGVSVAAAVVMGGSGSFTLAAAQATIARRRPEDSARVLLWANVAAAATAALAALVIGILPSGWSVVAAAPPVAAALLVRTDDAPSTRKTWGGAVTPQVLAGLVLIGAVVAVELTLANQLASFLVDTGSDERPANIAVGLLFAGMTVGRLAGALNRTRSPASLLALALGTTILGLLPLWLGTSQGLRLAAATVTGLGLGLLYPLAVAITLGASSDPERTSALSTVAIGTALLSSPLAVAATTDLFAPRSGFSLIVGLSLVAVVALVAGNRFGQRASRAARNDWTAR